MGTRLPTDGSDELYWRNQPVWKIEAEMVRRFEVYFTKKKGHPVKWCQTCRDFMRVHEHK